jgi:hypothetical protein
MDYPPFEEALPVGHVGEDRIRAILAEAGAQVQKFDCLAAFDFTATVHFGHPERIEVKNEDHYAGSGNICIELLQGKAQPRPSGISLSESTVCVHTLGPRIALYRTQPMRLFLKEAYKNKPLAKFGDNGNQGVVLPIKGVHIQPWFDITDDAGLASSPVFVSGRGAVQ